jgi:hypothetical protein
MNQSSDDVYIECIYDCGLFFFGRNFPGVENEADVPLPTSFPSLIILASVRLEMTVTAITL